MSLKEKIDKAETAYGISTSEWFKFKEGSNRLRVLAEPAVLAQHFGGGKLLGVCYGADEGCPFHGEGKDNPSIRWLTWVLDYVDGEVKLAGLPWSVTREIAALEDSEEYSFGSYPMPFDITINAKKAGTMDVEYSVLPARQNKELPEVILAALEKKAAPEQVVEGMKDKWRRQARPEAEDIDVGYPERNETNNAAGL